jgi:hypothetical protein
MSFSDAAKLLNYISDLKMENQEKQNFSPPSYNVSTGKILNHNNASKQLRRDYYYY